MRHDNNCERYSNLLQHRPLALFLAFANGRTNGCKGVFAVALTDHGSGA
jgi:hypothetical protein